MTTASETITLAQQLINIESITPDDHGCQLILSQHLQQMGFNIKHLPSEGVSNLWAERDGANASLLVFSGHTDVVPPGPYRQWNTPPFQSSMRNNLLFGRGAADMKGALAAMIIGCKRFLKHHPQPQMGIGFMITSDEEGKATHGTKKIVEHLQQQIKPIDYCIIGEASSQNVLGDSIKIGRRGSLHGELQVIGKQGHIAYPQHSDNPIHRCFRTLDLLTQTQWDQGNSHFEPTSFQIFNIHADPGASNVIPGLLNAKFNFRFSPEVTANALQRRVEEILDDHHLNYKIKWNLSSNPFLSKPGKLTEAATDAIQSICDITPHLNTTGGTSDGRFIAGTGCEIIELGVIGKSIHQVNEHASITDLEKLTNIYESILIKMLT